MFHKFGYVGLLLAGFAGFSCSRSPEPVAPPLIHFPAPEIDLGESDFAPDGREIEFPLENRGMSALRIDHIVSHCGCAAAHIDKSELAAEETARVVAVIAPQQSEERSAAVTVYSNDPMHPTTTLRLRWKAVAPIDLVPSRIDLGTVRPGDVASGSVDVVWRSADATCRVKAIIVQPDSLLHAEFDGDSDTSMVPRTQQLSLTVTGRPESGRQTGSVILQLAGCWKSEIYLPVTWQVLDVIEVSPSRVFLGSGVSGETREQLCKMTASEGCLFVESAEPVDPGDENPGLLAKVEPKTPSATEIKISWKLPELPGLHNATVRVRCTQPEPRELDIPVSVFVRSRPG